MSKSPVPFATTLLVRDACLCLHVQRTARALARRFDDALRPVGLTNGQFSLLMSLNRPHPAAMREVASLLAVDRTTLTAALKPLERRGLVAVQVDPTDRRSRLMVLTAAGQSLLAAAVPLWQREHAATEAQLGQPHADRFRHDLGTLAAPPGSARASAQRATFGLGAPGALIAAAPLSESDLNPPMPRSALPDAGKRTAKGQDR